MTDEISHLGTSRIAQLSVAFLLGSVFPSVYLFVTQMSSSSGNSPPLLSAGELGSAPQGPHQEVCVSPAFPLEGIQSDWNPIKRIPPVAECTVQGFPIERLEPEFNFRRGYALGFTEDKEDKTHLLPFLRATRDTSLATRNRRVLMDFGGRSFDSSVTWFLQFYPLAFTEIYVFEALHGFFKIPQHSAKPEQDVIKTMSYKSKVAPWAHASLPDWALDRIHLQEAFVNDSDIANGPGTTPSVNISRVIRDELNLTRDDTVIIKMDIEWAEWSILPVWLADLEMPKIVDELFVEVHYQHPTMLSSHWTKGPPRENATQLLQDLREAGFFVHPWP